MKAGASRLRLLKRGVSVAAAGEIILGAAVGKHAMLFDLRQLEYFVAVAEELNFRRAAARIHVTQPALSEQIRQLEAALEVPLLIRTTRMVRLTEPGHVFLAQARLILEHASASVKLTRLANHRKAHDISG